MGGKDVHAFRRGRDVGGKDVHASMRSHHTSSCRKADRKVKYDEYRQKWGKRMNNECYQLFATCGHVQTIYGKDDVNMMFICDPYGDNPHQNAMCYSK